MESAGFSLTSISTLTSECCRKRALRVSAGGPAFGSLEYAYEQERLGVIASDVGDGDIRPSRRRFSRRLCEQRYNVRF